jgi:hypothetical protein
VDLDPAAAGDIAVRPTAAMLKQLPGGKPAGPSTSLACSQSSLAVQTGAGRNLQGCRFLFLSSWPAFSSSLELG